MADNNINEYKLDDINVTKEIIEETDEHINGNIKINIDSVEGGTENGIKDKKDAILNGNNNSEPVKNGCTELLDIPRTGHRMSCMEEESLKERLRVSLLKQCSAILKQGDQKYTKESLHKTFQDEVSLVLTHFY